MWEVTINLWMLRVLLGWYSGIGQKSQVHTQETVHMIGQLF